ncbi:MAG TPA: rhodanese-like domain-containing protein [Pyrinomonadaceae bacterium]|nr:rhodanese-like domain-containing protein [Pyrinomonadaceae bacterium]
MRLKFFSLTIVFLTAVILSSCNAVDTKVSSQKPVNSAIGPETTYADGARRITIDELETLMKDGQVLVLDVRNQASYDMGHIPGSRLIPAGEILNHVNELPHDKMIVTYCS